MSDANRTQMLATDPNRTVMGTAPSLNATQTIKPIQCPVCKSFNPAGVMFCVDCGLIFDRALPDDAFGAPVVQVPTLIEESGREHPLRPGKTVIGREGDVMIADGKVSRRHAVISNEDGKLFLEDTCSTNGTKLNDEPLAAGEKRELKPGDKISFGGVGMQVTAPGAPIGSATQTFGGNKTAALSAAPALEKPAAYLVGPDGEKPLKFGPNIFGRKPGHDLQISDPYVSGKHGQIEITDEGVFLTDLGSSNGTMVNEAKLTPNMRTLVGPDDVIRLGSLEFRVRVES